MSSLSIANVEDNTDGWGPTTIPEQFQDVPYYSSFNKSDKLGKAADWQSQYQAKQTRYQQQRDAAGQNTIFNFYHQDDDSTFQLVDSSRTQTRRPYGNRRFQNQRGTLAQRQPWNATVTRGGPSQPQIRQPPQQQQNRWQTRGGFQRFGNRWGRDQQNVRKRDASLVIKPEWTELDSIEFAKLNKLDSEEPAATDLKIAGSLEFYDKAFDRVSSKAEKSLQRTDRVFYSVNARDDPILQEYAKEDAEKVTVFTTDNVLTHLMAATRTVYSWDIVVEKKGSKLFFERRPESKIEQLTVNETATEPPSEEARADTVNSPASLADEALAVNQYFSQQVLSKDKSEKKPEQFPHPFKEAGATPAGLAYKYRKWTLGDITVVARTEVDGLTIGKAKSGEQKELQLTIKALNEYAGGTDWRKKIDLQRGALLATEMKNNSSKLAKWTMQSFLAGTDLIKMGFVTRQNPKDNTYHNILAVQDYNPKEFATTLNFSVKNAWAVLRYYADIISRQEDGTYIIFREAERNMLHVYNVPADAFDTPLPVKEEEDHQNE